MTVRDVWMPSKTTAIHFGVHYADIVVISATAKTDTPITDAISEK
jgi:hypothetical protein